MKEGEPSKSEAPIQLPEVSAEIDAMAAADQEMRQKAIKENSWDATIDARNTARMKEIIGKIGWPTAAKVGRDSSSNAWLLVQHADRDVQFQEQCLVLMKQEPMSEVDPRNIAMLEDRVRVNSNQSQLYGTQYRAVNGEHKPLPIEDETNVDKRRKQMGLDTLEENIAAMYKAYGPPKQS
ncbi:hypothetical protein HY091_02605 [Candidatus Kaiserbacteria bacterium]|nr:hypothetical protein [Candidatus Kaiserbacteria bacterium]